MLKIMSKMIVTTLGISILGSAVASPIIVSATEKSTTASASTLELNENLRLSSILDTDYSQDIEIIGIDENGKEYYINPNARFSSSIIYIGVKIKYTSKADGNKLMGVFNQSYGMGAIGDAIGIFSSALGGLPGSIVGGFVSLGFNGFRNRCKEGVAAVKAHPAKGAINMYLDHVTWTAS